MQINQLIKNAIVFSLLTLTLFTLGCSSTPKVTRYCKPVGTYTFGQAPKNTEYADKGKIWDENAKRQQAARLGHQSVMAEDEHGHVQRMTNMLYIREEADLAERLKLDIEDFQPQAPVQEEQQQAVPASRQPAPSSTPRPSGGPRYQNGRLLPDNNGLGTSIGTPANNVVYTDTSLRAQPAMFLAGITTFLSGGSNYRQPRKTGIRFVDKGVEHQRSINPRFDRQRVGTVERKTRAVNVRLVGATRVQSGRSNRLAAR